MWIQYFIVVKKVLCMNLKNLTTLAVKLNFSTSHIVWNNKWQAIIKLNMSNIKNKLFVHTV